MATNFYLDNKPDKRGNKPIMVSISVCGARFRTTIGAKVNPDQWNPDKQKPKKGADNKSEIESLISKITNYFATYELTAKDTTTADLKEEWAKNFAKRSKNPQQDRPLRPIDVLETFVEEEKVNWSGTTARMFTQLKNNLIGAFGEFPAFAQMDNDGLTKFVAYLREKGLRNTTSTKMMKLLNWFLRWSMKKGYHDNNAFATFEPTLKKPTQKKVVFLEWGELMNVLNYDVPANGTELTLTDCNGNEYKKKVQECGAIKKSRDIFCFCAVTSLRYSDAINLKWSNIDLSKNEMTITTQKTADTLTIELNKYALSLLEKYRAQDNAGFVFPRITNQRMNIYLKELCEMVGLNQPIVETYYIGNQRHDETKPKYEHIGTHTARRTFICNALSLGIPCDVVMQWTGHSDYKAMKPYIAIADATKKKAMKLFDEI